MTVQEVPQISPNTTTLDKGNAYWMARLSKEVYLTKSEENQLPDEETILANLKKDDDKFISVFGVDNNSAQAAVVEHEEYLCIAFRGTNELADWLDNINTLSTEQLFGDFHRGFWDSVEDVWEPLDKKVKELQAQKKRPLFVTGHSLGGAMATVATARLVDKDEPFTSTYTFGQPRALRKATAKIFDTKCKPKYFRFQNNNDIVTRVPSSITGYEHIGNYLYISEEKTINKDASFWYRFQDYIDGFFAAFKTKGFDGIEDHDIQDYLDAIQGWDFKTK